MKRTWERHLRWAQIRRSLGAPGYILELLMLPHVLLAATAVTALVTDVLWGPTVVAACAIAYIITCISETVASLRWSEQRKEVTRVLQFAAVRQLGQMLLWLLAWGKSEVNWRGNRLHLGKGSRLTDDRDFRRTRRIQPPFARQAA